MYLDGIASITRWPALKTIFNAIAKWWCAILVKIPLKFKKKKKKRFMRDSFDDDLMNTIY